VPSSPPRGTTGASQNSPSGRILLDDRERPVTAISPNPRRFTRGAEPYFAVRLRVARPGRVFPSPSALAKPSLRCQSFGGEAPIAGVRPRLTGPARHGAGTDSPLRRSPTLPPAASRPPGGSPNPRALAASIVGGASVPRVLHMRPRADACTRRLSSLASRQVPPPHQRSSAPAAPFLPLVGGASVPRVFSSRPRRGGWPASEFRKGSQPPLGGFRPRRPRPVPFSL
jgi:hypothetical protein